MPKWILAAFVMMVSTALAAETEQYRVLSGGTDIGHLTADIEGGTVAIDYDYKNNGRGPTMAEEISINGDGIPLSWRVTGTTTFGSQADERYDFADGAAIWRDATGEGRTALSAPGYYVSQNASPWQLGMLARALLADEDREIDVLPGGTAHLVVRETMTFDGSDGAVTATTYEIGGLSFNPSYVILDQSGEMFAFATPEFAVVRAGYESADQRLRDYVEQLAADRFADIQERTAHNYSGPVRIRNVRVFDTGTMTLTDPVSVVWNGDTISGIQPVDEPATPDETIIDGAGGTLVPGLFDMHGHVSQSDSLLNIAAGITSIRDIGNNNAVLSSLIERIEAGEIAGPRVTRAGFIEGASPFSSRTGLLVSSREEAIEAVRWYAARGFIQIKIYNSIDPAWVPAMIAEAHRLDMGVAGHIPAFSRPDAMIEAGYDELTHINQVMLGWVLEDGEDTRTLLRFTALARLADLDLQSDPVQHTLDLMVANNVTHDATLVPFEGMLLSRTGEVPPGMAAVFDHLPVSEQRSLQQAWLDVDSVESDAAYREAFEQMVRTVSLMRERGLQIVPGTDMGGSFYLHRELELMERAGYTAPELLRIATLDMARYLGQDQRVGSIERGKLADFFLVPGNPTQDISAIRSIAMVVADGTIYFPGEIYPEFGIQPFADAPQVMESAAE